MNNRRVLPVILAAVMSVCLNTAPFSLAVHAAEEACTINVEKETSTDVSECQNTDEPGKAAAAEEPDSS